MEKIYFVKDAADYLGVDPATIRKWAKRGKIKGTLRGHFWMFTLEQLKKCPPRAACGRPPVREPHSDPV